MSHITSHHKATLLTTFMSHKTTMMDDDACELQLLDFGSASLCCSSNLAKLLQFSRCIVVHISLKNSLRPWEIAVAVRVTKCTLSSSIVEDEVSDLCLWDDEGTLMCDSFKHRAQLPFIVGSDFGRYYLDFRRQLLKQSFADRIQVIESQDLIATGRFQVIIRETKEKIHSNSEDGARWPQDQEKEKILLDKITAAIKELDLKRAAAK